MTRFEDLPYRPCVGLMVLNCAGLVFIGRRSEGPEHIDETHVWQMPQGGIDRGEDPWPAALRNFTRKPTSARSNFSERSASGFPTTFRATSSAELGAASIAARPRSGMRCVLPVTIARSTFHRPAAAMILNLSLGNGRRWRAFRTSSCRSNGRPMSGWCRNSRSSHVRKDCRMGKGASSRRAHRRTLRWARFALPTL